MTTDSLYISGLFGIPVLSFIAAGAGAYIGGYLKKKGDNLATHEDIDKIVDQVKATTEAAKAIEAKIDDQVWNRQRQWELKRDILVDFARTISDFEQAVMQISTNIENRDNSIKGAAFFNKALAKWNEYSDKFERDSFAVGLVVSIETRRALGDLSKVLRNATTDILGQQKGGVYQTHHRNIIRNLESVRGHIREELGIEPLFPIPQSSESSAAPTPGS